MFKLKKIIIFIIGILIFYQGVIYADQFTDLPTFFLPNNVSNPPYVFPTPRVLENGYYFRSFWYKGGGESQSTAVGPVYTNSPSDLTWGIYNAHSRMFADPGSFDTKVYHYAATDAEGKPYYSYGMSQAWNWYVLSGGTPGEQVTLAMDMLIQGRAFANSAVSSQGGTAFTIFGVNLGFLSDPTDLIQDYVMRFYGTVGWTGGLVEKNTFGDSDYFYWNIGNEIHELNYIIRSQPFTVTVGVPFRLSMLTALQGASGETWGEAWSDFFDPRIVTIYDFPEINRLTPDGFSILREGQYSTLRDQGYSIASVPEPATIILLGCGLGGLIAFRRKLKK